jgi:peptidoglycan/xylan/chitin deacetylase (PgdA/CDA1 family)
MGPFTNTRIIFSILIFACLGALMNSFLLKIAKRYKTINQVLKHKYLRWIIATSLAISLILIVANFYVYYGFDYQPDIYRRGSLNSNQVTLTFDDGPSREYTAQILDILKEKNVKATFFMVGSHVEKYPEIAARIVDEGHEVGNHTYHHVNVPTLTQSKLTAEIIGTNKIVRQVTGETPTYLRPPRGMYDARYRRLAHLIGQEIVLWTISGRDWKKSTSASNIIARIVNKSKGGEIILLHDSGALIASEGGDHNALIQALPKVIDGLREKGLEIVPLKDFIDEAKGEDITHFEFNLVE